MFKRKLRTVIILIMTAITLPHTVCHAEGSSTLLQAYAQENHMDVFVTENLNQGKLSLKVSNNVASVIDSGIIGQKDVTVRTTVLLDVSASVPAASRSNVVGYIDYLIENIGKNEQIRLVTFDEQLTVLQDFTSDRYDLSHAADGIEFKGQQSMLYDALYNTIPAIQSIDGVPCFYHTIVITDGIDDTVNGVTKEELYLKLQNEKYPIDVVAVSKTALKEPEKELSALLRMSGGRYANIYPEADIAEVFSSLSLDNVFWIRAEVSGALLDGSTRQVNLTDGNHSVQFDLKLPIYDVSVLETPEPESGSEAAAAPGFQDGSEAAVTPESQDGSEVSAAPEPITEPTESVPAGVNASSGSVIVLNDHIFVFIIAGVVLIILATIIIAVAIIRGKNKKQVLERAGEKLPEYKKNDGKTKYLGEENMDGVQFTIRLSCPNNPGKGWTLPVNEALVIGRAEYVSIRLEDTSVSHEHCKIIVQDAGLAVVHLSQTNKTILNGTVVRTSSPLQSGDTLKLGRELLHIDYIQSVGEQQHKDEKAKNNRHSSNTESIF